MRKLNIISLLSVLFFSCTSQLENSRVEETLCAGFDRNGKACINTSDKSVWNLGDRISVFVNGGENECWDYAGEDMAPSGTFTHISDTYRFEFDDFVAVYPYDAAIALSGGKIAVFPSFGQPLLAAKSSSMNLVFDYMTSIVRIAFDSDVEVDEFVICGNAGEKVGGTFAIDCSGDKPELVRLTEAENLSAPGGAGRLFCLYVPPVSFSDGFNVDIKFSDGHTSTLRYTSPVNLAAGHLLDIDGGSDLNASLVLVVDFRENNPFNESMPTSGGSNSSTTTPARTDRTYTLEQDGVSYEFGVHAGYYQYPSTDTRYPALEYGVWRSKDTYFTESTVYCLHIGRDKSYIKFPVIPGKHMLKYEYMVGNNNATSVYLAADPGGEIHLSEKPSSAVLGEVNVLSVHFAQQALAEQVYLYIGGGNHLIPWFKLYYY